MRVLLWHVHGSWTTALVQGDHDYIVPLVDGRGPNGRGRAQTWEWPDRVVERTPEQLADEPFDVVLLQRPHELEHLCEDWTGRRPGGDVPAIYVEHNAPQGRIMEMRHPAVDRDDLVVCHVTHFNHLFWDCGTTLTRVVEHGIVDPGERYTGELPRAAAVINEAPRRGRVTGTDLLHRLGEAAPIDLFGMDALNVSPPTRGIDDVPQDRLHDEMARRRVYLHPIRWTSLGLSLIEAMQLGMPVVALATTEAPDAVPAAAGVVSTRVDTLRDALAGFVADADRAAEAGRAARRAALERYGLERFLDDWDALLDEVAA
jgi:hypothetical protein